MMLGVSFKSFALAILFMLVTFAVGWWFFASEAGFLLRAAAFLFGSITLLLSIRAICLGLKTTDADWQTDFLVKALESRFRLIDVEFDGAHCWIADGVKRLAPQYFDYREWHGYFHLPIGDTKYQSVQQAWLGKERRDKEENHRKIEKALAAHDREKKRQR